jgi:hypothetical protein
MRYSDIWRRESWRPGNRDNPFDTPPSKLAQSRFSTDYLKQFSLPPLPFRLSAILAR